MQSFTLTSTMLSRGSRRWGGALAGVVITAAPAIAGLTPSINLAENPRDNGDGTYNWTYNVTFTNNSDVLGRPVDALNPAISGGTFITFFDVGGFVSAQAFGDWGGVTVQPTGGNAFGTFPVNGDDASLVNVTIFYQGPFRTDVATFTDFFTIRSTSNMVAVESFTSQFGRNSPPAAAGSPQGQSGFAVVPAPIPAPGAAALLGLGGVLMTRRRR